VYTPSPPPSPNRLVLCASSLDPLPAPLEHLVAVMHSVERYASWLPSWRIPRLGLIKAEGGGLSANASLPADRAQRWVRVRMGVPWPFGCRGAGLVVEGVDALDEWGEYVVTLAPRPTLADEARAAASGDGYEATRVSALRETLGDGQSDDVEIEIRGCVILKYVSRHVTAARMIVDTDPLIDVVPNFLIRFIARQAIPLAFKRFCQEVARVPGSVYEADMAAHAELFDHLRERCDARARAAGEVL
jgi:hypothetical protein